MADTVRVKGFREFQRACDRAGKETKKTVRDTFKEAGEVVRVPWRGDLARFGRKTETGLRTVVRTRGVSVEQVRRKSRFENRRRPKFGLLQQRLGDAVLEGKRQQIERDFSHAIDKVADHFDDAP